MNRQRRANAGVNSRYDEQTYCLVSFPNHSKHAIVPSVVVDVDPIDHRDASIKIRGIRRDVHIIGSGKFFTLLAQCREYSFVLKPPFLCRLSFRIERRNTAQGVEFQLPSVQ